MPMPMLMLFLAATAATYLSGARSVEQPHPSLQQLDNQEDEIVATQRDQFMNQCIKKEDAWFKTNFGVKTDCNNKFWGEFNRKFEKTANVRWFRVEYKNDPTQ